MVGWGGKSAGGDFLDEVDDEHEGLIRADARAGYLPSP